MKRKNLEDFVISSPRNDNLAIIWSYRIEEPNERIIPKRETINFEIINQILTKIQDKVFREVDLDQLEPSKPFLIDWIIEIIKKFQKTDKKRISEFMELFRGELYTTSKKKGRFIIIVQYIKGFMIVLSNDDLSLFLAEKGFKTGQRALDTQNIYRFIDFKKQEKKIIVKVYEYNKQLTEGFSRFLGLNKDSVSWNQIGDIKIFVKWKDTAIIIPLNDEDFIDKIGETIDLENNKVLFDNTWIKPDSIIMENKEYRNFKNLNETILTIKADLAPYIEKWNEFISEIRLDSYTNKLILTENGLFIKTVDGRNKYLINNKHPYLKLLFTHKKNPSIKVDSDMLEKIYSTILKYSNKKLKLYHPEYEFADEPIQIGNLEIYNQIKTYKEEYKRTFDEFLRHSKDIKGRNMELLFYLFIISLLETVLPSNFAYVFSDIRKTIINPNIEACFHRKEIMDDEVSDLIEFKREEFIQKEANPKSQAKLVLKDIRKKIKDLMIYCIGIDEETKNIVPLRLYKSEQFEPFRKILENTKEFTFIKAYFLPINNEGKIIVIFIIK